MTARRPVPVLAAAIAVLLGAGGHAAATVDAGARATASDRVGAAGFAPDALIDDVPAAGPVVAVATTIAVPSSTVAAPASTPPSTSTPPPTLPPTLPGLPATTTPPRASTAPHNLPPLPPPPTIKPSPPASKWSKTANGVTLRMHIEPAVPAAGQPVTFVIDELTGPAGCCIVHFSPETGTTLPLHTGCGIPSSGLSHTHTYAEAGVKAFLVMVLLTSCPDGQGPAGMPMGVDLIGCVAVGPDAARSKSPVPPVCGG